MATSSYNQLKNLVAPPVGADGMSLGQAFVATTILAIVFFLILALATILFGGAYWFIIM